MKRLKKKSSYLISLMVLGLQFVSWKPAPPKHFNFIVLLADDMGWTSLSTGMDRKHPDYKSDYFETPNLDRLGNEGMRFSRGYAAAICTPSRRSIQFGQSTITVGQENFSRAYNPENRKWLTIPWMLKSINPNYQTAHYGKWDLRAGISPEDLGYDESSGDTRNDQGDRMIDKSTKFTRVYLTGDPKRTVSLTARALDFMERQVKSGHPFYLQVSYYATHVDIQSRKETYRKYANKAKGAIQQSAGYAAMLQDMDTGIGKILDLVEQLGIADNTYIFFLTDNGGVERFPPPHASHKLDPAKTYNYPLRGGKWVLYEGGIRVPFMVAGPGIPSHSYCSVPVREFDILPTISELASNKWPLPGYLDGGSLKPLFDDPLKGEVTRPEKCFYFHRFTKSYEHSAVVEGDYKLIIRWKTAKGFTDNSVELYNIRRDIGEQHNIAKQMPDKASELKNKLITYLTKEGIAIPEENINTLLNNQ